MSGEAYWTAIGGVASAFAILGSLYGFFRIIKHIVTNRPFKQPIWITSLDAEKTFNSLLARRGQIISMDTILDFSWIVGESGEIWHHLDLKKLFSDGALRNAVTIPIMSKRMSGRGEKPVSLDTLRIVVRDPDKLRLSYGGTGIIRVSLKGRFEVEARAFSGPSTEITLRESP